MTLSDQQLRQELISYGETVPPINQRNREQLRARLEVLRSQTRTRTRTPASPSRIQPTSASPSRSTRATASPSVSQVTSTASPSRSTRAVASPSLPQLASTGSPSRTARSIASPSRPLSTNSPSRTRSSITTSAAPQRPATRSQPGINLIELSDSETDSSSTATLMTRSTRSGQTPPNVQTRSNTSRQQQDSPTVASSVAILDGPTNITSDVEQSIARHRREIKQLLDSARDRNRTSNTTLVENYEQIGVMTRSSAKARMHEEELKQSNDKDAIATKSVSLSPKKGQKRLCVFTCVKQSVTFARTKYGNLVKTILKLLLLISIVAGSSFYLYQNFHLIFPSPGKIYCTVKNTTTCEQMLPVIAAVRKQLQVRTGEVDCGFRARTDIFLKRSDIEKHLDDKGFTFNGGNDERWNAILMYIINKPLTDIILWDTSNKQTQDIKQVKQLSTAHAIRSLTCRARQDIDAKLRNLILAVLGTIGMLTLFWYLRKLSKAHKTNEQLYHTMVDKVTKLLEEQHEKHAKDSKTHAWLAVNHILEKVTSEGDCEKLNKVWKRVQDQITNENPHIRSGKHEINGQELDTWQWVKSSPKKTASTPQPSEEANVQMPSELGLTECLKLRYCFRSEKHADDEEISDVLKNVRKRCADVKEINHIGVHSGFVYLKLSSKEAAGQAYDLLNNWKYQDRTINVKYIRVSRYHEHFPEARNASPKK